MSFSAINPSQAGRPGLIYYDPINYSVLAKYVCTQDTEGLLGEIILAFYKLYLKLYLLLMIVVVLASR